MSLLEEKPDPEIPDEQLPVEVVSDNCLPQDLDADDAPPSDEFYETHHLVADPKQALIRLDRFIMDRLSHRSRSKVQNAIRAGTVLVDDQEVKPNYKVKPGNQISIVLPRSSDPNERITPQKIPLNILYEDDDVMVIDKQANLAVHPGVGIPNGTLVNAVAWHLKEAAGDLPIMNGNEPNRPGIVHRIDKDTTGLMVIAKNDYAMAHLANQFYHHTIERRYYALVWGDMEGDEGTIRVNIGRNPNDRRLFMVFPEGDEGKHAITHWRVVERYYYVTLVECRLETGRTHQIRVHMKSIGHTLFGDPRYGGNQILKGTLYSKYKQFVEHNLQVIPRQALHAKVLGFTHPTTGEHVRFESDLPFDMKQVIERWRIYLASRKK